MSETQIDFTGWTQEQKEALLRPIAEAALAEYDLGEKQVTFLCLGANGLFRVQPLDGSPQLLLRIHSPYVRDVAEIRQRFEFIRSGLQWLAALRDGGGLTVTAPIVSRDGSHVRSVSIGSHHGIFNCSLVTWVEGEPHEGDLTADQTLQLGEALGRIHKHSSEWPRPETFSMPRYDWDNHQKSLVGLRSGLSNGVIDRSSWQKFVAAAELIKAMTDDLGESGEHWGLIHADYKHGNYVFSEDKIGVIDFDSGGFGHYGFDIGSALASIHYTKRRDFLAGYQRTRPLPQGYERFLEGFLLLSNIRFLGCFAPGARPGDWLSAIACDFADKQFAAYLNDIPFLFTM